MMLFRKANQRIDDILHNRQTDKAYRKIRRKAKRADKLLKRAKIIDEKGIRSQRKGWMRW